MAEAEGEEAGEESAAISTREIARLSAPPPNAPKRRIGAWLGSALFLSVSITVMGVIGLDQLKVYRRERAAELEYQEPPPRAAPELDALMKLPMTVYESEGFTISLPVGFRYRRVTTGWISYELKTDDYRVELHIARSAATYEQVKKRLSPGYDDIVRSDTTNVPYMLAHKFIGTLTVDRGVKLNNGQIDCSVTVYHPHAARYQKEQRLVDWLDSLCDSVSMDTRPRVRQVGPQVPPPSPLPDR